MMNYNLPPFESHLVERNESFFSQDMVVMQQALSELIGGARILLIGGAGSIGFETLKVIVKFAPKTVHVIDHNENGLAELVRMLRASADPLLVDDLMTLPFDYGGEPFRLWLLTQEQPYDYVFNFAALKHVRSEKDPYSILAMLETNVWKQSRLSASLSFLGNPKRLFSVSTDKAANPSSMMGATKRLMEHALFSSDTVIESELIVTSARFANVAMSNGSLLQSWQT